MGAWNRFRNLWHGRSLDRDFEDEIQFHLERRTLANQQAGMSRAEAEREARRHFGGVNQAAEGMREARVMLWLEAFGRDLRQGARLLRKQPAMTALAVLALSLGIGANAVLFARLYDVLVRPLPFADADRLVAIVDNFRTTGALNTSPTVPELLDVKSSTRNLEGVSFFDTRDFQINGGTEPARVFAARVEASFLSVLGVRPALGRLFADGEDRPGRDRVAILTDGLWRRNFGADPGAVGGEIVVNGAPSTIIGVLPPDFAFDYLSPEPIDLYVPFPMNDTYMSRSAEFANVRRVTGIARLRPDHRREWAAAELKTLSETLVAQHPQLYRLGSDGRELGFFMNAVPLQQIVTGRSRSVLWLLVGAVGLVLLVACGNTAQFLLARALERRPEAAIRAALGAGRGRLIGQFLAEAMLLALLAGVVGVLQAEWLARTIGAMLPGGGDRGIDAVTIASTTLLALATTLVFGLIPALHFASAGCGQIDGRTIGPARLRTRHALVAIEVAISIVMAPPCPGSSPATASSARGTSR
jgi:putative ABC transport system permease protein